MTVRELIESLLDYDMEAEVEIRLDLNNETDWYDFDYETDQITNNLSLTVNLSDSVLIDEDRLEELEDAAEKLEELED